MIRLGLCCQFRDHPVKFRSTTATHLKKLSKPQRLGKISELCLTNGRSLLAALEYCAAHRIAAFRVMSPIWPIKTHPEVGYAISDLPNADQIIGIFQTCGDFAQQHGIRLSMHPDQFVLLNSPRPDVVERSLEELAYHAEVAELVGVESINIHGGGGYGNKPQALDNLHDTIVALPAKIRQLLTLENDDRVFTPSDLLPVCQSCDVPLVYDVHHHRCLPDQLTLEEATMAAISTFGGREPIFHISSPKQGWDGPSPQHHHDFIDPTDFPLVWLEHDLTVEVEAKAKELAVANLAEYLGDKVRSPIN